MFGYCNTVNKKLDRIEARIIALDQKVERLTILVKEVRFIVGRPEPIGSRVVEENGMSIRFAVVLPVRPESDGAWNEIASGELSVVVPGLDPIIVATAKAQQLTPSREIEDPRFVGPQGAMVELAFVYIDNAGNKSLAPATNVVELVDTVPPVNATMVTLRPVEETEDAPTPPVE